MIGMLITMYSICTFLTIAHEAWNMKNPRRYPKQTHILTNWEVDDFYSFKIDNEWVLRKHRKIDTDIEIILRNQYWKERYERSKRRN